MSIILRREKSKRGTLVALFLCCFTSQHHLRSNQDGHQLATVHTHGNFIVLSHFEIRLSAPLRDIPLSHILLTLVCSSHSYIVVTRKGYPYFMPALVSRWPYTTSPTVVIQVQEIRSSNYRGVGRCHFILRKQVDNGLCNNIYIYINQ